MAAISFQFELDSRGFDAIRGAESALVRAVAKAGGDGLRALRVAGSRRVRERKRVKVSRVNASLPLAFPRRKKELYDLVWRMGVSARPIPLIDFPHRQTKKGVSVSVDVGKGPRLIKSGFIATMRSGHVGIFTRVGKQRLPIREGFGTRLTGVFRDQGNVSFVLGQARETFAKSLDRILPLEIAKGSK